MREWLGHRGKAGPGTFYWTGGVVNSAAGRNFFFWHHSRAAVAFSRFAQEVETSPEDGVTTWGIQLRNYRVRTLTLLLLLSHHYFLSQVVHVLAVQ